MASAPTVDDDDVVGTVEAVVLVTSTVDSVEDVASVVDVVSTASVVVVVGATVVVARGAGDDVDRGAGAGFGTSDGSPGAMRRLAPPLRRLGAMSGPAGPVVDVDGELTVVGERSVRASPPRFDSTEAWKASGAATITAMKVDKDNANRNRRRPFASSGRCMYIGISRASASAKAYLCFTRPRCRIAGCGINSPDLNDPMGSDLTHEYRQA